MLLTVSASDILSFFTCNAKHTDILWSTSKKLKFGLIAIGFKVIFDFFS